MNLVDRISTFRMSKGLRDKVKERRERILAESKKEKNKSNEKNNTEKSELTHEQQKKLEEKEKRRENKKPKMIKVSKK